MTSNEKILNLVRDISGHTYYVATGSDMRSSSLLNSYYPQVLALYDGPEISTGGKRILIPEHGYLTLIYMPYLRLMQQFDQSRHLNDATFLGIVLNSQCIHDDRKIDAFIRERAQKIINRGPFPMRVEQNMRIRIQLTEQITLLRHGELSLCENHAELAALAFLAVETLLRWQGHWIGRNDRRACQQLQKLIPKDTSGFAEPLQVAVATGNPENILSVADQLLNALGGPIQEFLIANPW